jgi:hypothetical protein
MTKSPAILPGFGLRIISFSEAQCVVAYPFLSGFIANRTASAARKETPHNI